MGLIRRNLTRVEMKMSSEKSQTWRLVGQEREAVSSDDDQDRTAEQNGAGNSGKQQATRHALQQCNAVHWDAIVLPAQAAPGQTAPPKRTESLTA